MQEIDDEDSASRLAEDSTIDTPGEEMVMADARLSQVRRQKDKEGGLSKVSEGPSTFWTVIVF